MENNESDSLFSMKDMTDELSVISSDETVLFDLCNKCFATKGMSFSAYLPNSELYILLRYSLTPRYYEDRYNELNGQTTLDIIHLGWMPFFTGEQPLSNKKKNLFDKPFIVLMNWCNNVGKCNLYIENVLSENLYRYFINRYGFQKAYFPRSLIKEGNLGSLRPSYSHGTGLF